MSVLANMAEFLGITSLRLVVYTALTLIVITGAVTIRQHFIDVGWQKHKAAIEWQDNLAIDASRKVEARTQKCSEESGFWDVITQACKMEEETKR